MNFKEWLANESPISNFQLLGNWAPGDPLRGYKKKDVGILTNPKGVEKIHRKWSNTKENFDIYFLRAPNAKKQVFVGAVTQDWVKSNLGLDIHPNRSNITLIYTQNSGGDVEPMTAWIMAHRMAHALNKYNSFFRSSFAHVVENVFIDIFNQMFPGESKDRPGLVFTRNGQLSPVNIAWAVGTMRSARNNKIPNFFEFVHELVAQYIINGKITFNPLPRQLIVRNRYVFGKHIPDTRSTKTDDFHLESLNELVQHNAKYFTELLDEVFADLRGEIIVI